MYISFKNVRVFAIFAACLSASLITGCACKDTTPKANKQVTQEQPSQTDQANRSEIALAAAPVADLHAAVTEAVAYIKPVAGQTVQGKITFMKVKDGVKLVADLDGLTPGLHGFHVHEHGDCGGKGAENTGSHFNPTNQKHGGPDSEERHVGDLGNIEADAEGRAHLERVDSLLQLEGPHSIIGRSIVVHADKDDYTTQPSGNSGDKIGCGVIEAILNH